MEESSDIPIFLAVKSKGIPSACLFRPVDLDKGTAPRFPYLLEGNATLVKTRHREVGSHVLRTHQSEQECPWLLNVCLASPPRGPPPRLLGSPALSLCPGGPAAMGVISLGTALPTQHPGVLAWLHS